MEGWMDGRMNGKEWKGMKGWMKENIERWKE